MYHTYSRYIQSQGRIRTDNTLKIRAFVETVEYGSFTLAANRLGCAQSGVSRMISDLEKEWNVSLMERGRGGISLTPEGESLLPYARMLCSAQDDIESRVSEINGLVKGKIRIGTFSSVATHWLPNIIRMYRHDYPKVENELLLGDYTEIASWVREGRVDIGFTRFVPDLGLETEILARDRLMAVVPAGERREIYPLKDLADGPFMLLEKGAKAEISELFESNGLAPNVVFTTWDDYAVMSMVESGLGVSILPELILRRIPYRISAVPIDVPAYRDICLVMRDRSKLPVAAKRFLDYLKYRENQVH